LSTKSTEANLDGNSHVTNWAI